VGAQTGNIGRGIVLSSKVLPISVPGTTVDRQCGSSLQAFHFASQAVMSGTMDCVIACGVEVMSLIPLGAAAVVGKKAGMGTPMSAGMEAKWPGVHFSQFEGAEMLAAKHDITRDQMEDMALESHRRADAATKNGHFQREIVPLAGHDKEGNTFTFDTDEGIRWPGSKEKMASLKTLKEGGRITAALASQVSDGASAVMVMNERGLARFGLAPRAVVRELSVVGSDPQIMLEGPIPATQVALARAGLEIGDIDLYEVNEAFASVPAAWARVLGADLGRLNVNGGAMALGHPLGCTGTKLVCQLFHDLERQEKKRGLVAICEGGGTANASIIERVSPDAWKAKARL
jgi:acetyl-CoA C-acetyltransferase